MKTPLYFHLRDENAPDHTYCIDQKEGQLFVGYSVVHENDHFNRKRGRDIASGRMNMVMNNREKTATDGNIHPVIEETLPGVLERARKLIDVKGPAIICGHNKGLGKRATVVRS